MSENSNTATAAEKTIEIVVPEFEVNEMLAALGVPFPDAAEIDRVTIRVDHDSKVMSTLQDFGPKIGGRL